MTRSGFRMRRACGRKRREEDRKQVGKVDKGGNIGKE